MTVAKALPTFLKNRHRTWRANTYPQRKAILRTLADEGQTPSAMVISCCDSRVKVMDLLGGEEGDFFVHRNIANLVPPYLNDGQHHGTSAAIEYAVTVLKVPHLIIMGHSKCGGVKGCHDMCCGNAPELEDKSSFVGRWVETLRPGYERLAQKGMQDDLKAFEQEGVMISIENLMAFPFVAKAVNEGSLSLHGLWTDIGEGEVYQYNPASDAFEKL